MTQRFKGPCGAPKPECFKGHAKHGGGGLRMRINTHMCIFHFFLPYRYRSVLPKAPRTSQLGQLRILNDFLVEMC